MSRDMAERRESDDSTDKDKDKKRKRPESAGLQFVNITHPDQSKTKAVLKTVRQQAMNSHLFQNSSPDLEEGQRVSRQPRRLRSLLNRSLETPMPEPRIQRAASVPKEARSKQLLAPSADAKQSRRVSSVDVFSRPSPPKRSRDSSVEQSSSQPSNSASNFGVDYSWPYRPRRNYEEHIQMLRRNCDVFFGTDQPKRVWRARGASDRLFYLSSLCISAKHTEALLGTRDTLHNLALDAEVVQTINEKLQDPQEQASDSTIAAALHVAICYNYGVPGRMDWYNLICTLVELRGGLINIDTLPGLTSAILINGLGSAIFQETAPHSMFISHASFTPRSPPTPRKLESPIFWPNSGPTQLENSVMCSPQLLALLQHVRHAIDVVAAEGSSPSSRKASYQAQKTEIRNHLLTFPQGPSAPSGGSNGTAYIYESCRIAAIILERALHYSILLSEAVRGKELLRSLKEVMLKTDLESGWGDLAGALLWVSYIGAAASNGVDAGDEETRQLRAWLVGCATRITIQHAFTSPGEIVRSLYTLSRVQEVCALRD